MIKAIWLFYVFKFSPRFIDNRSSWFWRWQVRMLNNEREKAGGKFYFWKLGRLHLREPHAIPNAVYWTSSSKHPVCWYKPATQHGDRDE